MINYLYIKSEESLQVFVFPKCSLFINEKYLWWVLNCTRRSSFWPPTLSVTISFWVIFAIPIPFSLPPLWVCVIKFSIPKIEPLVFGITCTKASKTVAYRSHAEEADIATVVPMNRRRDNSVLNAELFFLCNSGCSVSN